MIGIHTHDLDIYVYIIRLKENGFVDIGYTSNEGSKYIYDSIEEHSKELEELIDSKVSCLDLNIDIYGELERNK